MGLCLSHASMSEDIDIRQANCVSKQSDRLDYKYGGLHWEYDFYIENKVRQITGLSAEGNPVFDFMQVY